MPGNPGKVDRIVTSLLVPVIVATCVKSEYWKWIEMNAFVFTNGPLVPSGIGVVKKPGKAVPRALSASTPLNVRLVAVQLSCTLPAGVLIVALVAPGL